MKKINGKNIVYLFFFFLIISCSQQSGNKQSESPKPDSVATQRLNKNFFTDCKILLGDAKKMDSILLQQSEIDEPSANKAIKAFADFANYCHQDTLSPVYLIECAQVARAINNIPQAKVVLNKCVQDYPQFKDRAAALFLLAQLYDEPTYLNNESEAKRIYEQIIDEYPKSDWAVSSKGAINFIGKSDAEIMRELKKSRKIK